MAQNVDPLAASKFCAKHCEDKTVSIEKCYKKQTLNLHPDKNRGNPNATKEFQEFGSIYREITDDDKQKKCNEIRAVPAPAPAPAPSASSPSPVPARGPARAAEQGRLSLILGEMWNTIWSETTKKDLVEAKTQLIKYISIFLLLIALSKMSSVVTSTNNKGYAKQPTWGSFSLGGSTSKKTARKSKSKKRTSNKKTSRTNNQSGGMPMFDLTSSLINYVMIITCLSTLAVAIEASVMSASNISELQQTGNRIWEMTSGGFNATGYNAYDFNMTALPFNQTTDTMDALNVADAMVRAGYTDGTFTQTLHDFFYPPVAGDVTQGILDYCGHMKDSASNAMCDSITVYQDVQRFSTNIIYQVSNVTEALSSSSLTFQETYKDRSYVHGLNNVIELIRDSMMRIGPSTFRMDKVKLDEAGTLLEKMFKTNANSIICSDSASVGTGFLTWEDVRAEYDALSDAQGIMGSLGKTTKDKAANMLQCSVAVVLKNAHTNANKIFKLLSEIATIQNPVEKLNKFFHYREIIVESLVSIRGRTQSVIAMISHPETMTMLVSVINEENSRNKVAEFFGTTIRKAGEVVTASTGAASDAASGAAGDLIGAVLGPFFLIGKPLVRQTLGPKMPGYVSLFASVGIYAAIYKFLSSYGKLAIELADKGVDITTKLAAVPFNAPFQGNREHQLKLKDKENERIRDAQASYERILPQLMPAITAGTLNPADVLGALVNISAGQPQAQAQAQQQQYALPAQVTAQQQIGLPAPPLVTEQQIALPAPPPVTEQQIALPTQAPVPGGKNRRKTIKKRTKRVNIRRT